MEQTSVKSTNKISFKKIARGAAAEWRVHKKSAIITIVMYGVAALLFLFNASFSTGFDDEPAQFYPSGWGMFFSIVGICVGYFTALNMLRDMNNQQLCDVSMALPIKASERFFSKLLGLFYIQILPLLASTLGANGIAVLFGALGNGGVEDEAAETIFMIALGCLAASMFIMSIAVLCVCCCGARAESAYFSIILMFVINALPMNFAYNIISNCAGFNDSFWIFSDSSNIDLGYWGFMFLFGGEEKVISHCLVGCLISLAVMLLSGLIYKKRDARSVGTPIASRVFFEIIMALGCVTVFSFFAMSSAAMWGVLLAGVAYIVINIIVCRAKITPLSFLKWSGKYIATAAAFTAILVVSIKTGGFGYINARPDAQYLEGAEFTISYFNYDIFDDYYKTTLRTKDLTSEQADQIMKICKKHIIKGRTEIPVFNVIFGRSNTRKYAEMRVLADSDTTYRFCPSPQSQFDWRYVQGTDGSDMVYCLDFDQRLRISLSEAKAMMEELDEFDFVYNDSEWAKLREQNLIELM